MQIPLEKAMALQDACRRKVMGSNPSPGKGFISHEISVLLYDHFDVKFVQYLSASCTRYQKYHVDVPQIQDIIYIKAQG